MRSIGDHSKHFIKKSMKVCVSESHSHPDVEASLDMSLGFLHLSIYARVFEPGCLIFPREFICRMGFPLSSKNKCFRVDSLSTS